MCGTIQVIMTQQKTANNYAKRLKTFYSVNALNIYFKGYFGCKS